MDLRLLARVALATMTLVACRVPSPASAPTTPEAAADRSAIEADDDPLASLSWLAGTWISSTPVGPVTVEHWLAPAGGTMLGVNRTAFEGRTVFFEYLRIEATPERTTYLASPLGRDPPTPFTCIQQGPGIAVFENPDHDYPQRIEYRLAADELRMTISGTEGGEAKSSQWTMIRAPDPPRGGP